MRTTMSTTDGFFDDDGRWLDEARARRKLLRKHNTRFPQAPLCAGCGGIVRGRDVGTENTSAFDLHELGFTPDDIICFNCWLLMEDVRLQWGHC
jgi:hypothetical protein